MRLAVSAEHNEGLDSPVSAHFGRCPYFVIVDVAGREVRAVSSVANPFLGKHAPGQVPQFISQQQASVILTGGMGRRAIAFFQDHDIEAVCGAAGTVRQSLERYLNGELKGADPCAQSQHHHGG